MKEGIPYGQGTFTFLDGWKYQGGWVFGKYHGQGTMTSPYKDKYVGEWKDGMRSGQGTQSYPNGGKYEGSWKNGVRWNGTSYDKDGEIYKKYVNGVKQ